MMYCTTIVRYQFYKNKKSLFENQSKVNIFGPVHEYLSIHLSSDQCNQLFIQQDIFCF